MTFVTFRGTGERQRVGKVVCVGRNYPKHATEMGYKELPKEPVFFYKPATSIIHDGGAVRAPTDVGEIHHEVELAFVIGERAKDVPKERALDHVAGYAVLLDITARDVQSAAKKEGKPWGFAKGLDTFAPISDVAPASEVADPQDLTLHCEVNGEVRQHGSTSEMVFTVADIIAYLSKYVTLEPGDVVATGSPEGVGAIRPGDTIVAEVEGVGRLQVAVEAME